MTNTLAVSQQSLLQTLSDQMETKLAEVVEFLETSVLRDVVHGDLARVEQHVLGEVNDRIRELIGMGPASHPPADSAAPCL